MTPAFALALLLAATSPGAPHQDTVERTAMGHDGFEITYTAFGTAEPAIAQGRLMPEARKACAPKVPVLGKFRFEGNTPLDPASADGTPSVTLVQQIHCASADADRDAAEEAPAIPTGPNVPSPTQDTAHEKRIVALSEAYLDARRTGDFARTHALMSESYLDTINEEDWRKQQDDINRMAGEPQARIVYRVTWYDDPPGVMPGHYAAADFVTLDTGLAFHCGYLAWRQRPDGDFRVVREEDNYLDADSASRMSEAMRREAQASVGCPDVSPAPK